MQFTSIELDLNLRLATLLDEWREMVREHGFSCENFVTDGFYPYYTEQKQKVLFIGRESLGLSGCDYIETLYADFKRGMVGDGSINEYKFHAMMFYIAWAVNNGFPDWQSIPYASELVDQFAVKGGFSFAFMNLSKFSNESDSWQADWPLIDSFINASEHPAKNLFNEQIKILKPDIIITMNLQGRINSLGYCEDLAEKSNNNVHCYNLFVDGKFIPLYDMFHFSAPGKSSESDYYLPLKQLLIE